MAGTTPSFSATGAGRRRGRDAQLIFEALTIEGALLSADFLARIAQLDADAQKPADYRVPKGLHLRDEIGRSWHIARAEWLEFRAGFQDEAPLDQKRALSRRFLRGMLRDAFGFRSLEAVDPVEFGGRTFAPGFAALGGQVPVVLAPAGLGLDALAQEFGDGHRRRSPFGLCQELLNADDRSLWGLVSDGWTLRLLRDNESLTRPAWIEADLGRIFEEESYADFSVLWLLIHASRFGRFEADGTPAPAHICPLERWRETGRQEGSRARAHLRRGVEEALAILGQGFLDHPDNRELRERLADGRLSKDAYYQELLRLAYRLIFLLTVEERGVLHPEPTPDDGSAGAADLYAEGYGLRRLRERAVKRNAHDRFHDQWEAVKIVFRALAVGEPRLALPALAGLFADDRCPHLDAARLENRALLGAMFHLSWMRKTAGLVRVNWRDMGPEELGSVYEGLLELVPQISGGGRRFHFAPVSESKGNARKKSGSYYTPDSLVQVLLDSALEPVIARTVAEHPEDPVEALLSLSVVDPACGSGHFLLGAARRLASHVARLQVQGTPSAADFRHALRQVVGRCMYGVDLNPLAVELCRVSLWLEAVEPGLPLTFLESHIRYGNALIGTTPELMEDGIPDVAWKPLEGDDRKVASLLKKRNKVAVGQRTLQSLWGDPTREEVETVRRAVAALDAESDEDLEALTRKETSWQRLLHSAAYSHQRLVADAWCAAFVWPKQPGPLQEGAPTNELWGQIRDRQEAVPEITTTTVAELAEQYRFFHWHLAFPQVFGRGGFDVVLGNPPWERIKLQEKEFFASRHEGIAGAKNAAARKKKIAALADGEPEDRQLLADWQGASRVASGQTDFVRNSGRYPLCGKGDINTYALFSEHNRDVLAPKGRAGFIVPTGIATDATTQAYFADLISSRQLASFLSFENEEHVFVDVHNAVKFALVTLDRTGTCETTDMVFFARQVTELADPERHFALDVRDFELLNPNTRTCPTFRSRRDADINLGIYRRVGVLWNENAPNGNPWDLSFLRMLDMAVDSGKFQTMEDLEAQGFVLEGNRYVRDDDEMLPLIEAKMVHHFDHRFGTYDGQTQAQANKGYLPQLDDVQHADPEQMTLPRYWVASKDVEERLDEKWDRGWLLGFRDVCRSTDSRTVIPSLTPRWGVGHKFPLMLSTKSPSEIAVLYANLCSFVFDYAARQKIGGTSLSYFLLKQLPVLKPDTVNGTILWSGPSLTEWILERTLELTYTAWDLQPFARDVGYDGPPFRWDPERRDLLRAELDAAFFHLYGLTRDETDHVMDSFPIVRRSDEAAHGEYRTKRLILEIYDDLSEAVRTGEPYPTRLDPPPAHPSLAHPDREADKPSPQ